MIFWKISHTTSGGFRIFFGGGPDFFWEESIILKFMFILCAYYIQNIQFFGESEFPRPFPVDPPLPKTIKE